MLEPVRPVLEPECVRKKNCTVNAYIHKIVDDHRQQHEVVSKQQGNVNITSKQQQVYVPSARISKQRDHQHISAYIYVHV